MTVFTKIVALIIAVFVIAVAANAVWEKELTVSSPRFGVTFSPRYAEYLGLDWQKTYLQALDNLKVRNLRIPSYWDVLEPEEKKFSFAETDFMLNEASKRGARMIVVVGIRQPRWPECHIPSWAKKLPVSERQQKLLQFIGRVVDRYRDKPQIWAWQVENEPLLSFGEGCDSPDQSFLKQEMELVRSKSGKTIIMTDSGELGFWEIPMSLSDIFGTTMYRKVYDRLLGYVSYPLPPLFYNIKSSLVRDIFARGNQKTIIIELQAEPWLANGVFKSAAEQVKLFTPGDFKNSLDFAQKTGFDEIYLWGVEWWYFMDKNGHPEYLDYAKTLF